MGRDISSCTQSLNVTSDLYDQTRWDKSLHCGIVYKNVELGYISMNGLPDSIGSSMHNHWPSNKSSSMNKLARYTKSLRTLQIGKNRHAHCDNEKKYVRSKPSLKQRNNERTSVNVELSSLNSSRQTGVHAKATLFWIIENYSRQHSQNRKCCYNSNPDHISATAFTQATFVGMCFYQSPVKLAHSRSEGVKAMFASKLNNHRRLRNRSP